MAVGDGNMPVREIFEALIKTNYKGFVDLEYEDSRRQPDARRDRVLRLHARRSGRHGISSLRMRPNHSGKTGTEVDADSRRPIVSRGTRCRGRLPERLSSVKDLPIVSPHGHTQAAWFAKNEPFPDPAKLFVQPDHYVFRMLYSQGVSLDDLEIGQPEMKDPRKVWRIFASHYYLFRGTPTRIWLDFAFQELFGLTERLSEKTADLYLRHHLRKAADAGVPAPRPLRALQS